MIMGKLGKADIEPYSREAQYYDLIYHTLVDYAAECKFLERLFKRHSKNKPREILDVGCGTGNHSLILSKRGYRVVGIDRSEPMLKVARRKSSDAHSNVQFEHMDMRKISIKERKFDVAVILFGGFTYLLKDSDVESCFSSIRKHLNPGGLIIFEFWQGSGILPVASTSQGYRYWDRMGDEKSGQLLIRLSTGRYDSLTNRLTLVFDHYVFDTKASRTLDLFQETHVMRTYDVAEVKRLLIESGFNPIAFYAKGLDDPPKPPTISTPRIICVATPKSHKRAEQNR
jgi:ubiquinone/menaquinone biosynthesis C-methylase UbiE